MIKRILLCSGEMPSSLTELLGSMPYRIIKIPRCESLSSEVEGHPDMIFSVIGERHLLTDKRYFSSNKELFDELAENGINVSVSERELSDKYPSDILFDAIRTRKLLVGNLRYTAPELLCDGIKTVNVKQGYALCSTLLMENAAICADAGICGALLENGYDVLKISVGGIALNGYSYGFIGGASAVFEREKTVVFFGNVYAHEDGERMARFCESKGYKVLFDENIPLADYGGVKII